VTLKNEKKKDKSTIGTLLGTTETVVLMLIGSLIVMCFCMECKKITKDTEKK